MSISYGGDNITFPDGSTQNTSPQTGFVNRIINGAMTIDQRNAGASVSLASGGGNTFSADRWFVENFTDGTATVQQITDAPTGFSNSIRYTVTATDSSLASDQSAFIQQRIEGFNFADMLYGTASAQTVTVSFWVKSSVTGTYGVTLANSAYNRGYPASFTVSAANTWEQKSVTIAGDTTGTWIGSTNGIGVRVSFCMAAGSARASASGAWAAATIIGVNSQVNLMATNGATFQVSGVQLEKGSTATPFEFRSIGQELALCQRYFEQIYSGAAFFPIGVSSVTVATSARGPVLFYRVTKRSTPTIAISGSYEILAGGTLSALSTTAADISLDAICLRTDGTSMTAGQAVTVRNANDATAKITASAEL